MKGISHVDRGIFKSKLKQAKAETMYLGEKEQHGAGKKKGSNRTHCKQALTASKIDAISVVS